MNFSHNKLRYQNGIVLLVAMLTTAILLAVIAGVLSYTVNTFKNSTRKLRLTQVKTSANNEMEYLFYSWVQQTGKSPINTADQILFAAHVVDDPTSLAGPNPGPHSLYLATSTDPYVDTLNVMPKLAAAPAVNRGLSLVNLNAQGSVKNASSKMTRTGNVKFYTAKIRTVVNDPLLGPLETRIGRRFIYQTISACNGAIYYQNDMEWGVGSNMDISGDIECNGSIYMGSSAVLTIHDNVYYKDTFNGSQDNLTGAQRSIDPGTFDAGGHIPAGAAVLNYSDPVFASSSDQVAARNTQVRRMGGADNMLGFSDPSDATSDPSYIASHYPTAYPGGVNDVYRSLIAPPPTDSFGLPIAEDPRVAATRTYNKAGVRITISGNAVSVVDPNNPSVDLSSVAAAVVAVRSPVWDAREGKNVNMTTLDMAALTTAINNAQNGTWQFNGVLYIDDQTTAAQDPLHPGPNAIRIENGTRTPNFDYSSTDPQANANATGFTLCTDNGLYIQGDLNTAAQADPGGTTNRTSVMADAVTFLSQGWDDAKATASIDPTLPNQRMATHDITVNSAILSGNVATAVNPDGSYSYDAAGRLLNSSGGVQNLVRYLENWLNVDVNGVGAHTSTIHGSIAQLFYSKHFTTPFKPNTVAYGVYLQPTQRVMQFDPALATNPPFGMPFSVQNFYRGDLFEW